MSMKFDVTFLAPPLSEMSRLARAAEDLGFDGLWVSETKADPFLALALAARATTRLDLGTGIAVAFARSPTVLAYTAWGLQELSQGRFLLGLGSQVRGHIERRFGMKWDRPLRRMRETVEAIRAVWRTWQTGEPLRYRGEIFRLSLMTPFFQPDPLPYPPPPILISAVNRGMLRVAGRVADGVVFHALHTVRYLREYAWPHLQEGLQASGRSRSDFTALISVFAIPTDDPDAPRYEALVREQIGFYLSTPAYRVLAQLHGWEDVALELGRRVREGRWQDLPHLVTEEMVETIALRGPWEELGYRVQERYGDLVDRVSFYLPFRPGEKDAQWRKVLEAFHTGK